MQASPKESRCRAMRIVEPADMPSPPSPPSQDPCVAEPVSDTTSCVGAKLR